MGLLGKAIAMNNMLTSVPSNGGVAASGGVQFFVTDFHHKTPQFHALVFQGSEASRSEASRSEASRNEDIINMIACHGGAVAALPGGKSLVLLPGALDRELFAHRLSHSAGLATLSQLSADSPSLVLEALSPYL